jgi:phosphoribosylaminoimidazole (AIR) synthetase
MGIGMAVIVRSEAAHQIKSYFKEAKIIGHIEKDKKNVEII